MPNLFNNNLIKMYIQNHQIENFDEKLKVIQGWKKSIQINKGFNEKALQAAFLQGIFGKSLGYKIFGDGDEWQLNIEVSTEVDATTPDGILGFYKADESITQAVIELKSPRISLDKKQNRAGKDYGTPVDQAFGYASKYDRCSWVIVSNMNEIRLYKVGRSQEYYESFFIDDLDSVDEFRKFHLLLCKENLIRKEGQSPTFSLSEKTKEHIQDISISFYNLYKNIRIQLYEELKASNPDIDSAMLVEKAQKFLDRIIFVCFCEDLGLLPNNLLHHAIQRGKDSFSDSEYVIWQEIRGVFRAIDVGSTKHNIPAYNGGLFAFDEMLDNLSIRNNFFDTIYEISAYDFGTDLNVNILGHIFEQSISDIEELKAGVQNEDYDPQKSRRKKEGIYYTPSYITKYIVENSLGKYLEDIRKSLGEENLPDIEEATTAQLEGRYKKKLLQFYLDYEARLKQVKVLDPACGSGAFLNQAFDFLLDEYRWIHSKLAELEEGQTSIFNSDAYQRSVLQDNLYGVDLNEESVEITKLSLWLKTADSRNALPYLDNNIKCGNSLIDDPEVAGDKAFKWSEEFPDIIIGGGFDIVIGNPPYVRAEKLNASNMKQYLKENYKVFDIAADLFAYFYERSYLLLSNGGYLGFISNTFEKTKASCALRKFISLDTQIYKYIDLKDIPVFQGTTTYPIILIIKKEDIIPEHTFEHLKATNELLNDYIGRMKPALLILQRELDEKNWTFKSMQEANLIKKICSNHRTIKEQYGKCYYGIKTGLNEAFITDQQFPQNDHLKNICEGKDLKKWYTPIPKKQLILFKSSFTKDNYGMDINYNQACEFMAKDFPEIFTHLLQFKDAAIKRYDKGDYWWELRKCSYYELFEQPKIVFPNLQSKNKFCIDETGCYVCAPAVMLPTNDYSLLAILNSKLIWVFLKNICVVRSGGYLEVKPQYFEQIPIPTRKSYADYKLSSLGIELANLNKKLSNSVNIPFRLIADKYLSASRKHCIENIMMYGNFSNKIYEGRSLKIDDISLTLNDSIVTIYTGKGIDKTEILKIEIFDSAKRDYFKLYLENLTLEQLAEINQHNGNILDKVLQIRIPDYDKPDVVRKVVNEWNQLQAEIAELESKIGTTDKEIDQLVYKLYGLTNDEIKLIEGNVD